MSYRQASRILARQYRAAAHKAIDRGDIEQARRMRDAADELDPGCTASVDERLSYFGTPGQKG